MRKPVNAPIVFTQCGGEAAHDYQVEHLARFQLDSTLAEAPTDTVGSGSVVQFVVDSAGRVIPESLYLVSDVNPEELEQIRAALPKWRFVPAQVGERVRLPRSSQRRIDHMLRLRLGQRHLVPILLVPAVLLVLPRAAQTQRAALTCPMIAGGGAIIVRGYEVVFSAASDTAGSTLAGLAVVRAPADFRSQRPSSATLERWTPSHMRHPGSGANVGPLMIVHESSTKTVWIDDSVAVRLTENNNVLLIDVDARGAFATVGQARIDPHLPLPTAPCNDSFVLQRYQETSDTLWARFQGSPQIRSFVSP